MSPLMNQQKNLCLPGQCQRERSLWWILLVSIVFNEVGLGGIRHGFRGQEDMVFNPSLVTYQLYGLRGLSEPLCLGFPIGKWEIVSNMLKGLFSVMLVTFWAHRSSLLDSDCTWPRPGLGLTWSVPVSWLSSSVALEEWQETWHALYCAAYQELGLWQTTKF